METKKEVPQKPYSAYFRYIKRYKEDHAEHLAKLTAKERRSAVNEAWRNISAADKKELEEQYMADMVAYNV